MGLEVVLGKMSFDEIVLKALTPLNEYIGESKLFYGYDISFSSSSRNFADRYATPESIEYRFLIPKEIVKKYKNNDITGQKVLDASIVFMNNERIELKLQ